MKQQVLSPRELGLIVRAVRKSSGIRQDELAALVGVSKQFATDVERGKATSQTGLVMRVLDGLGLRITVDVPDDAMDELRRLRAKYVQDSNSSSDSSGNELSDEESDADRSDGA